MCGRRRRDPPLHASANPRAHGRNDIFPGAVQRKGGRGRAAVRTSHQPHDLDRCRYGETATLWARAAQDGGGGGGITPRVLCLHSPGRWGVRGSSGLHLDVRSSAVVGLQVEGGRVQC